LENYINTCGMRTQKRMIRNILSTN
jgi:hypothetical protein